MKVSQVGTYSSGAGHITDRQFVATGGASGGAVVCESRRCVGLSPKPYTTQPISPVNYRPCRPRWMNTLSWRLQSKIRVYGSSGFRVMDVHRWVGGRLKVISYPKL